MGFLDRFRRKSAPQAVAPLAPDELRKALFDAANQGRPDELLTLCRAHRVAVLDYFPAWKKIPDSLRQDRDGVQWYGQGLIGVAVTFADRLNEPSLLASITSADDDPLTKWQERIERARATLMSEHHYEEAKSLLSELLIDTRKLMCFGSMSYPGLTHRLFGTCLFDSGEVAAAKTHFHEAVQHCTHQQDTAGVVAYAGALYEVYRYLGDTDAAADWAVRCTDATRASGDTTGADEWVRTAERVRAGEPLNRMVAQIGDRRFELDELPPSGQSGRVQFLFVRNRKSLELCEALVREGGELGSKGDYYGALDAFRRASKVDPFDPQPPYEQGNTLMHLQRAADAVGCFDEVERLAPGWFNCRGDRWLAAGVAAERVGHDAFLILRYADDGNVAPEKRADVLNLLTQVLGRYPRLAPLHLALGILRAASDDQTGAAEALRAGLACNPDPDTRSRLLAHLGLHVPDPKEKAAHWREAASLAQTGNLMAATMDTVALRGCTS